MTAPARPPRPVPGLLLRLAGPLQSWGEHSHFNDRDTLSFPTRSAVTGLLAAALGRPREHPLDDLADISITVRVDRPGARLRDFHTVGGGLSGQQTVVTADGGRRSGDTSTLTSTRWYLADAAFTLSLTRPDRTPPPPAWAEALQLPRWPLYLGRRSCPPAGPLLLGHSTDALHDLLHLPLTRPRSTADVEVLFLSDQPLTAPPTHEESANSDAGEEHSSVLDVPLAFTAHRRRYRARPLYRRTLTLPGTQCTGYGIEHLNALAAYTSTTYTPAHHPAVRQGNVT
ncbi:type I-E CRISPR-associated protein Cas5/CasD [Streptomyces sp. MNP-20]|uniref:type I-E CRISPR-associated protein Cas5/CasD n=1 Tax=Streptomyces sp. MNP-20 TaxID=2721165 RepID=UPI001553D1D6|nr:type I-E CRISPR-associated protein Cas5/CasD [Streptomyces sp. MNP-20]